MDKSSFVSVPASSQDASTDFCLSKTPQNSQQNTADKPIGNAVQNIGNAAQNTGNAAQNIAITHRAGPMLCLAGPGSGKTFTLVQHILFLIREEHISPERILVLTFSKAAAQEMEARYFRELRKNGSASSLRGRPFFGTFHALFFRILRSSFDVPLSLADTATRTKVLERLLGDFRHQKPEERDVTAMMAGISALKNGTLDALALENDRALSAVFQGYQEFLTSQHLIDFDDMALSCKALLSSHPDILRREQCRYDHILVDEFQDINAVQLKITLLLGALHRNYFVVGDDDQSIYGFRGSDPAVFQKFLSACPDARQVTLSVNYRCAEPILKAALQVIAENEHRLPKKITAARKSTQSVELSGFPGIFEETKAEAKILKEYLDDGGDPKDAAIILRTHAAAQSVADLISQQGIPIAGRKVSVPPCLLQILQDVGHYYQLAFELKTRGSADAALFYAVMNRPQRWFLPRDAGTGLQTPAMLLQRIPAGSPAKRDMEDFLYDLQVLTELSPKYGTAYLRNQTGLEAGVSEEQGGRETARIHKTFDRIEALAAAHRDIPGFLSALEKEEQLLRSCKGREEITKEGIRLLTMHACKGLEFSLVILPELNEGILPGRQAVQMGGIEEERRLFYVAMTRARDRLILHYQNANGKQPSRLLEPISGLEKKISLPFRFWDL